MINRMLVRLLILILYFAFTLGLFAQEASDVSPQWKRDKIIYTYGQCLDVINDTDICRQHIKEISKLEDAYASGIITIIRDFNVNIAQLNKQSAACRLHPDYRAFVDCHVALLGRIKDEINGETLLSD